MSDAGARLHMLSINIIMHILNVERAFLSALLRCKLFGYLSFFSLAHIFRHFTCLPDDKIPDPKNSDLSRDENRTKKAVTNEYAAFYLIGTL